MTYQERLIAGLTALGYKLAAHRSGKYRAFERSELDRDGRKLYLFVGSAGALRKGHCASDSFSIGDPARQTDVYKLILSKAPAEKPKPSMIFKGF